MLISSSTFWASQGYCIFMLLEVHTVELGLDTESLSLHGDLFEDHWSVSVDVHQL
jgi:hypothetical protein